MKHSSIIRLALPIAFAHLANMLMQIVDMGFIGRLGPEALGGFSVGHAVFAMVMVTGVGLLLGLDYFVSHALGAGNQDEANHMLIQGLYLATIISIPSVIIMHAASHWYEPFGIDSAIAIQGRAYLKIIALGIWPWLLFTTMRQYLQCMGSAVPVFGILIFANFVNAFFNYALVFGNLGFPALGVEGSAWATGIARVFMALSIGGYIHYLNSRQNLGFEHVSLAFHWDRIKSLLKVGAPAGGQLLLEVAVFAISTLLAGKLGAISLSAHQLVLQIASVTFMVPLGIASATAVLVARSLGAGNPAAATHYGWRGISIGTLFMLTCGIALSIFPEPLLRLFSSDQQVIAVGSRLILLAALFQLFDGAQVVGSGALRGIGNTRASLIANFVGHWLFGLPVGAFLCFSAGWGVFGLWVGLTLGLVLVAASLSLIWHSKRRNAAN